MSEAKAVGPEHGRRRHVRYLLYATYAAQALAAGAAVLMLLLGEIVLGIGTLIAVGIATSGAISMRRHVRLYVENR
jgi:hypothetical protein